MKIEDIGLTFNIPGYNDYELKNHYSKIYLSKRYYFLYLEINVKVIINILSIDDTPIN